jgi:outer membrane receptor protein involved in Fe transport
MLSASYSLISDMLFYSNIAYRDSVAAQKRGNYFSALPDDIELLTIHAEMNGPISDKLSYNGSVNLYNYTMSKYKYAWDKPGWDGKLGLKYNLRDKIIAGMEFSVQGKRREIVNGNYVAPVPSVPAVVDPRVIVSMPAHLNLNLSAEYRYSKILSFWTKLNNIANNRYYEWAYYQSQGFLFMLGFTYSL